MWSPHWNDMTVSSLTPPCVLSFVLQEIDEYIAQAKDRSYETMMKFGKRGLNLAANAAVTAATKVTEFKCTHKDASAFLFACEIRTSAKW